MTKTEKVILTTIVKRLKASAHVSWREGDINDWRTFAEVMESSIHTSTEIIENLITSSEDEDENTNLTI